jgi:hypothetical protein
MDTVMRIAQRDPGGAVNAKCVDSIVVRQRVLPQKPLVGAHFAGAVHGGSAPDQRTAPLVCVLFYRTALPIKTANLSPLPRDFDKASAATVGPHCRCGFHVRHAYHSRSIAPLYFVSGKREAWIR